MPRRRTLGLAATAGCVALLLLAAAAGADSLAIRPGLWRTTSVQTMEMPGMGAMPPRTHTIEQCLQEGDFDPAATLDPSSGCRIENVKVQGKTMSYEMVCPAAEGEMRGKAHYESDGDRGRGRVEMSLDMGGAKGRMTMEMTSERLGDCP